jgi:dUTP pyrophosphatase
MNIQLLSSKATIPTKGTPYSAGFDLYSAENVVIPVGQRRLVKTDIAIEIPLNHYGRIAPRSSSSFKNGILIGAGVIDSDYRGNIGVVMFNFGESDFEVNKQDRIAQLILERYLHLDESDIKVVNSLSETIRSDGGFGSTG